MPLFDGFVVYCLCLTFVANTLLTLILVGCSGFLVVFLLWLGVCGICSVRLFRCYVAFGVVGLVACCCCLVVYVFVFVWFVELAWMLVVFGVD